MKEIIDEIDEETLSMIATSIKSKRSNLKSASGINHSMEMSDMGSNKSSYHV